MKTAAASPVCMVTSVILRGFILFFALVGQSAFAAETVTYYYTSPQGTVLATTNAAGSAVSTSDYRPYGSQALGVSEAGPGYTGHVNDPDSGLTYMQARYYDPVTGF
ncbi:RHS repeat-associated protein [Luteibacter rhizovicinus]|uniref:RHS repeat-associated protein n=1 Tax=Luteibacter rhizovicinus TaxID=242606 RepID=A0A4R3YKW0_9GAMM|nr:RHS repeat-associated protein [Luteibacter rhizovicinus]